LFEDLLTAAEDDFESLKALREIYSQGSPAMLRAFANVIRTLLSRALFIDHDAGMASIPILGIKIELSRLRNMLD